jgi:hypothetical protein
MSIHSQITPYEDSARIYVAVRLIGQMANCYYLQILAVYLDSMPFKTSKRSRAVNRLSINDCELVLH